MEIVNINGDDEKDVLIQSLQSQLKAKDEEIEYQDKHIKDLNQLSTDRGNEIRHYKRELEIKKESYAIIGEKFWINKKELENQQSQLKAKDEENQKLKECLKTVRSQLYDKNNKETLLTNIIDDTLKR